MSLRRYLLGDYRGFFGGALSPEDRAKLAAIGNDGGSNGGHRQAPQAASGGTPDGAGSADAGAKAAGYTAADLAAFNNAYARAGAFGTSILPGAVTYVTGMPSVGLAGLGGLSRNRQTALQAQYAQMQAAAGMNASPLWQLNALQVYQQQLAAAGLDCKPVPEPEDAGITLGEIIAWRSWRLRNGLLWSMAAGQQAWAPDEPMTGEPSRKGDPHPVGVHAFKTQQAACIYASEYQIHDMVVNSEPWRTTAPPCGYVIGRVALWGEVIEHEKGYRAEFAKVHSLDVPIGISDAELQRLRGLYVKANTPMKSME